MSSPNPRLLSLPGSAVPSTGGPVSFRTRRVVRLRSGAVLLESGRAAPVVVGAPTAAAVRAAEQRRAVSRISSTMYMGSAAATAYVERREARLAVGRDDGSGGSERRRSGAHLSPGIVEGCGGWSSSLKSMRKLELPVPLCNRRAAPIVSFSRFAPDPLTARYTREDEWLII